MKVHSLKKLFMALAVLWMGSPSLQARPVAEQPMDGAVLQRQDLPYRFETLDIDSVDGQRHYRVWVASPKRSAPKEGFSVVYMLDGNAALGSLAPDLLQQLDQGAAPVLVVIGYATNNRIDRASRTLDYTPSTGSGEQRDPLTGQPNGGADAFLDLLQTRIKPAVAQKVALNTRRQTLWGHSYGGLLVLHALLTRPRDFQNYAAASPSLWWNDGWINQELDGFGARLGTHKANLLLMRGDKEPAAPPPIQLTEQPADRAARTFLASLQSVSHLSHQYKVFPGLSHGPMLDASLRYTLQWVNRQP
ncbi:alpha/beta hydrolase [Pseudomonas sp. NPDC089734]|uniref:alpha/beta hydrolase n=1 Tax=Pseudomonas sp. NPDC089734 TaxID=3364469 RepID=UPI00380FF7DC